MSTATDNDFLRVAVREGSSEECDFCGDECNGPGLPLAVANACAIACAKCALRMRVRLHGDDYDALVAAAVRAMGESPSCMIELLRTVDGERTSVGVLAFSGDDHTLAIKGMRSVWSIGMAAPLRRLFLLGFGPDDLVSVGKDAAERLAAKVAAQLVAEGA